MAVTSLFEIDYEPDEDILTISLARPQNDVAVEVQEDVFVHINPRTKRIVSITVLNFLRRFRENGDLPALPIRGRFEPAAALAEAMAH